MWIDKNTGETAQSLETRLNNVGAKVPISNHTAFSIAYSANGITLHQKETETVEEFRGLTKEAAQLLETLSNDTTVSTTYYRTIDGEVATAAIVTGTKTSYVASRANEANGWRVVKTTTVYEPKENPTDEGWTVSAQGRALTNAGVTVPVSQDRTATWQYGTSNPISSVVTTTVTEIRLLTETGKNNYLAQASNGAQIKVHYYTYVESSSPTGYSIGAWCYFNHGTDVMVSARYVSAEEGWTVTKTVKQYGFSPTGGSATNVGWWVP